MFGLLSVSMTMVPSGALDLEDVAWTPARLREHRGPPRRVRTGLAGRGRVHADGRLGFTELGVTHADRSATVSDALVLPEHRGHRLGLGMKLANRRRLLELLPHAGSSSPPTPG